ncbi:MAG: hypothetical protein LBG72_10515 [Spirochaetaceae bacterium]|jgi:dihydroxyacetone kinase phosphotransfer subunit|nr:hypothetical protein [Spirochaetaceae bacterium]
MVTLILLSHSPKVVEGVRDLALEMAPGAAIVPVGGSAAGTLGSDYDRVFAALEAAASQGEALVLADMGSAKMTGEMAREALPSELQERVFLCDAALVEGGLAAAVAIAGGCGAKAVIDSLEDYILDK